MTLTQIAEKPITVATEQAIKSFADCRQSCLAVSLRPPNRIRFAPDLSGCARNIAGGLSEHNDALIS
jgi:hypothetical protein